MKKRIVLGAVLLMGFAFASTSLYEGHVGAEGAVQKPVKSNVFFLGVGVKQVRGLNLLFTVNDVTAMKSFLIRQEGRLWGKVWEKTLVEQNASVVNVKAALSELQAQNIQPDDLVIVFLSTFGEIEAWPAGNKQFLVHLTDTGTASQGDQQDEHRNVLTEAELVGALNPLKSRVVVILDACASGVPSNDAVGGSESETLNFRGFVKGDPTRRVVWASSGRDSSSREDAVLQHGVFSYFLLHHLQVGVASGSPFTVGRLQDSVLAGVMGLTAGHKAGPQKPEVFGNRDLEFLPELR